MPRAPTSLGSAPSIEQPASHSRSCIRADGRLPRLHGGVQVLRVSRAPPDGPRSGGRAGLTRLGLDRAGVGGRRRRSPEDVADEVSDLYHRLGVRIIHLLDDNIVGGTLSGGREWAQQLACELERRGVARTAWSLMIDPQSVTEPLLDDFERLGVARLVVGIESLTDSGLRALGRPFDAQTNRTALERARRRGIATVFNILAVHPRATGASTGAELDELENIPSRPAWPREFTLFNNPIMAWGVSDPWPDPATPSPTNWHSLDLQMSNIISARCVPMSLSVNPRGESRVL